MSLKNTRESPGGRGLAELVREMQSLRMRDRRRARNGTSARLAREGADQPRVVVTQRGHEPRRVGVEVAPSIHVEEARSLGARDDQRIGLGDVRAHLGVRVPDVPLVERDQLGSETDSWSCGERSKRSDGSSRAASSAPDDGGTGAPIGRKTLTVVPSPDWLAIDTSPSWASTMRSTMASPSPVPLGRVVKKGSFGAHADLRIHAFAGVPHVDLDSLDRVALGRRTEMESVGVPLRGMARTESPIPVIDCTAFSIKLSKTCRSKPGSPQIE